MCNMQKLLRHFLIYKIRIVRPNFNLCDKTIITGPSKPLKYIFNNQNYCIFSWCTKQSKRRKN